MEGGNGVLEGGVEVEVLEGIGYCKALEAWH